MFSANAVRRTTQTQSRSKHDKETYHACARVQNHRPNTADNNYDAQSRERALEDYTLTRNVLANDVLSKQALANIGEWFPMRLDEEFVDLKKAERIIKRNADDSTAGFVRMFKLSDRWYNALEPWHALSARKHLPTSGSMCRTFTKTSLRTSGTPSPWRCKRSSATQGFVPR